ncbi:MAG: hypothetical protein ACTS4U_02050, partial [Candidatus Hodgkinia cicadicola]
MQDLVLRSVLKNEFIRQSSSINLSAESLMLQDAFGAQVALLPFTFSNFSASLIDELERLASARAKALFNCNYAAVLASDDCQSFE